MSLGKLAGLGVALTGDPLDCVNASAAIPSIPIAFKKPYTISLPTVIQSMAHLGGGGYGQLVEVGN